LESLLDIKHTLTRRQWSVLMEASLRVGLGMHVLWTCAANITVWELALSAAAGKPPMTSADIERTLWEDHEDNKPLLELGSDAKPLIERTIERHVYARTGLNMVLCVLEDAAVPWTEHIGYSLASSHTAAEAIRRFLQHVYDNREKISQSNADMWLRQRLS